KAQLQIGLCRLEQKRFAEAATALLVVPFTYDYPELNAVALCEAARAYVELKQRDHAEKLLQRVLREHPQSKWAEVARERLEPLKRGGYMHSPLSPEGRGEPEEAETSHAIPSTPIAHRPRPCGRHSGGVLAGPGLRRGPAQPRPGHCPVHPRHAAACR